MFASVPLALMMMWASAGPAASPMALPPEEITTASPSAFDRAATAGSAAIGAGAGALLGFGSGAVGHIVAQSFGLPTPISLGFASLGAPFASFIGALVFASPFVDSGTGAFVVATSAGVATLIGQTIVGVPFVLFGGRPGGSYELGIIPLFIVPPIAGALAASLVAPLFAAPAE